MSPFNLLSSIYNHKSHSLRFSHIIELDEASYTSTLLISVDYVTHKNKFNHLNNTLTLTPHRLKNLIWEKWQKLIKSIFIGHVTIYVPLWILIYSIWIFLSTSVSDSALYQSN